MKKILRIVLFFAICAVSICVFSKIKVEAFSSSNILTYVGVQARTVDDGKQGLRFVYKINTESSWYKNGTDFEYGATIINHTAHQIADYNFCYSYSSTNSEYIKKVKVNNIGPIGDEENCFAITIFGIDENNYATEYRVRAYVKFYHTETDEVKVHESDLCTISVGDVCIQAQNDKDYTSNAYVNGIVDTIKSTYTPSITTNPTPTQSGTRTWTKETAVITETIPALTVENGYTLTSDTLPTCYQNGLQVYSHPTIGDINYTVPAIGHSYENGYCTHDDCEDANLTYTLTTYQDEPCYSVKLDTFVPGTATTLVIPETHNGLPVRIIASSTGTTVSGIEEVVIPSNVKKIENDGFYGFSDMEKIIVPKTVSVIGTTIFKGCTSLAELEIPGNSTLASYFDLIPNTLTKLKVTNSIVASFALDVVSLKEVTIDDSINAITGAPFEGCSGITTLTAPGKFRICVYFGQNSRENMYLGGENGDRYIPNGLKNLIVTRGDIAQYFAANIYSLTNVELKPEVNSISTVAPFYNDSLISEITIPSKFSPYKLFVTTEPSQPEDFYQGTDNKYIPNALKQITVIGTSIPQDFAKNMRSLTTVIMSNDVTGIGKRAFSGCTNLEDFALPTSLTGIGEQAFYDCEKITNVVCPDTLVTIGQTAYSESGLVTIQFNEGLTTIGSSAFKDCTSLQSFTIPSSVTTIGSYAFEGCTSLAQFTVPSTVTSLGLSILQKCNGLTTMTVPGSKILSAYFGITNDNMYYVNMSGTTVSMPKTLTTINVYGTSVCKNFAGSINNSDCIYLTTVNLSNEITSIGNYAFKGCTNLTTINLPTSLETIGEYAFYKSGIQFDVLTFPSGVTNIPYYAFNNCHGIESVVIGDNITSIGAGAFYDTYITELSVSSNVTSIGSLAFGSNTKLETVTMPIPDTNKKISYYFGNNTSIISLTINSATELCDYFGSDGNALAKATEIILPEGLEIIGQYAFKDCVKLEAINIPSTVTSIKSAAYYNCYSAKNNVVLPAGLTNLGGSAFYRCSKITGFTFLGTSLEVLSTFAFYSCDGLTSFTVPYGVTTIGSEAFEHSSNLAEIHIPVTVTTIEYRAMQSVDTNVDIYYDVPQCVTSIETVSSKISVNSEAYRGVYPTYYLNYTAAQHEEIDVLHPCCTNPYVEHKCKYCEASLGENTPYTGEIENPEHTWNSNHICEVCSAFRSQATFTFRGYTDSRVVTENEEEIVYYGVKAVDNTSATSIYIPGIYNGKPVRVFVGMQSTNINTIYFPENMVLISAGAYDFESNPGMTQATGLIVLSDQTNVSDWVVIDEDMCDINDRNYTVTTLNISLNNMPYLCGCTCMGLYLLKDGKIGNITYKLGWLYYNDFY